MEDNIIVHGILNGFDLGRDVYRRYTKYVISKIRCDSSHFKVIWEIPKKDGEVLFRAYHSDISHKITLIESN